LGLIAQALTASTADEVAAILKTLGFTAGTEQLIHESFDPNDPNRFTRPEFGWANAMYSELLFRSAAGLPAQALYDDVFEPLLPRFVATPTVARFTDQLVNRGIIEQRLEQSCTGAIPLCYIR
jgi:hypothetical protein